MKWTRRELLQLGFGALALQVSGMTGLRAALQVKNIPLCLQLYSVRDVFGADPEKVFAAIAGMGYQGVEYAGMPLPVEELRKLQDKYGLICTGSHTGRDQIDNLEALKNTIEQHLVLGAKFIICPGMHNEGKEGWIDAAKKFSAASEVARKSGLYVGYHAHQPDYRRTLDGESPWEIFADASCADVVMQNDLGHCVNSGTDPYELIKKYPGRSKSIHLKESDNKILGEGRVDWAKAFELCETVGGVVTYTIEAEMGGDTMDNAKRSAEAYQRLHK